MTDVALIFPGQGAQVVGMGREFYDASPEAKKVFTEADSLIEGLSQVIFEGPQYKLTTTAYCQPAILTMSIAALKALEAHPKYAGINPRFSAGLSLGEYSALIAAGVFSFEDGLRLVQRRAALMDEACKLKKGAMAAVIGFDNVRLAQICNEAKVGIANFNSHQQTVITGYDQNVAAACEEIKQAGAKNVIPLEVSGAFHSSLMQSAAKKFTEELKSVSIDPPKFPVISNVIGRPQTDPSNIRENLAHQITSCVQWVETIEHISKEGVKTFLEIGPGTVLKGLIRKIDKDLKVYNIGKPGDIESLP